MHGKAPRPRKQHRLNKLDLFTPEQRRETALKLIKPTPEKDAECKIEINRAIESVEKVKTRHKHPSIRKQDLDKAIKSLKAVVNSGFLVQWSKDFVDQAIIEREILKQFIAQTQHEKARHGGTLLNAQNMQAALCAGWLLTTFGTRRAPLTQRGPWHELAAVLVGYKETDLFDFDYLRRIRHYEARGLHARSCAIRDHRSPQVARNLIWIKTPAQMHI
jgi:hypothetical protein